MKIELKPWSSIGKEEEAAVLRVVRSGTLSGFLGGELDGGQEVRALEQEWAELNNDDHHHKRYPVAVNSATSGILIALKAVGVRPGTKVICSPYSMSAGVACILWCGAEPVFVDIGDDNCLDPAAVAKAWVPDVSAILVTNLFGRVANRNLINFEVPVIEDNAQAPLTHNFFGDIAVDSFNVHKPMQAGEGGICTAKDFLLDITLKRLRNHGEISAGRSGLNLRMTELTAAIAREQIKKGRAIIKERQRFARKLTKRMPDVFSVLPYNKRNAYYVFPIRVNVASRDRLVKRLQKLGVPVRAGYGGPLYNLPAFKPYARECPNCELIEKELIILEMYAHAFDEEIIDQIVEAFHEVAYAVVR